LPLRKCCVASSSSLTDIASDNSTISMPIASSSSDTTERLVLISASTRFLFFVRANRTTAMIATAMTNKKMRRPRTEPEDPGAGSAASAAVAEAISCSPNPRAPVATLSSKSAREASMARPMSVSENLLLAPARVCGVMTSTVAPVRSRRSRARPSTFTSSLANEAIRKMSPAAPSCSITSRNSWTDPSAPGSMYTPVSFRLAAIRSVLCAAAGEANAVMSMSVTAMARMGRLMSDDDSAGPPDWHTVHRSGHSRFGKSWPAPLLSTTWI